MLGFETIGNATLICHDRKPLLVTDPWITGSTYFGSWGPLNVIPPDVFKTILDAPFFWLSHGHPDHTSHESLMYLRDKDKHFLLPDHVGSRMYHDLKQLGFQKVTILPDFQWIQISDNVRICSICDYYQDAILLVEMGDTLICNINDAGDRGWYTYLQKLLRESKAKKKILLKLFCYGDVDMINFYDEHGNFIEPPAAKKEPLGPKMVAYAEDLGCTHVVPFSAMHRIQRTDSIWAEKYATPLEDFSIGFKSEKVQLVSPYIRWNIGINDRELINPKLAAKNLFEPEQFGDCWAENLTADEAIRLQSYFQKYYHLREFLDFIQFKVGSQTHTIQFNQKYTRRGIIFSAPRHSLMLCVDQQIFDDLLIGNFIKTQLLGQWEPRKLYPHFTPFVAKFGDNGRAFTEHELEKYFQEYKRRHIEGFVKHAFDSPVNVIRKVAREGEGQEKWLN